MAGCATPTSSAGHAPAGATANPKLTFQSDHLLGPVISTSYTERANLTLRMSMRRFTRLTNAFSKKLENHAHMVALYALWYNFVRIHKMLKVSPAMAAGIETRLWSMEDVARLCEPQAPAKRGTYKPRAPKVA